MREAAIFAVAVWGALLAALLAKRLVPSYVRLNRYLWEQICFALIPGRREAHQARERVKRQTNAMFQIRRLEILEHEALQPRSLEAWGHSLSCPKCAEKRRLVSRGAPGALDESTPITAGRITTDRIAKSKWPVL